MKLKWFYPGMKIKRWVGLIAIGMILVAMGAVEVLVKHGLILGWISLFIGVTMTILGIRRMVRSLITVFLPNREQDLVDIVYQKRYLERGPKIVVIGGGTGLSVLLHGLKQYTSNITAVVTVADDGGSSGRLRDQFDVLPPGDIRNCLVALADTEPLMSDLFQFRFGDGSELKGHSFGNLFITALTKITGDFEKAVKASSQVLAIRGRVIPATYNKVTLVAKYKDNSETAGEASIPKRESRISRVYLRPDDCPPSAESLSAIMDADAIILGPGSLYTSVIPNLLIKEIPEAILRSKAIKIYICNVMTQAGETDGYTAFDHVNAIITHTKPKLIDYCIVNTARIPEEYLTKYNQENASAVVADIQRFKEAGTEVIGGDVISAANYVRHNPDKLAKLILNLIHASMAL